MIKYKNNSNTKKGFTLIEIIISIALLAIISIAFLSMFTTGIVTIINSGKKSASHYTAQNQIESNINDSTSLPSDVVTTDKDISLIFNGKTYVVDGRQINATYTNYSGSTTITTFTTN